MKANMADKTLFLVMESDLVASRIEELRDSCRKQFEKYPDAAHIVIDVSGVEFVDSLGVNLIVGLYRQASSESKTIEINGAGKNFMKIANFFRFPSLFPVKGGPSPSTGD